MEIGVIFIIIHTYVGKTARGRAQPTVFCGFWGFWGVDMRVPSLSLAYPLPVPCLSLACPLPVPCLSFTCPLPVPYLSLTYPLPIWPP